jgi:hypothetical protein
MDDKGKNHWRCKMKSTSIFMSCMLVVLIIGSMTCIPKVVEASEIPLVEVVFCLDTTGSMGGLIEGAKQKIWSIANEIVIGRPVPELRIGLVGYRDYGDEYVTRIFQLNDDLDAVYEHLMSFRAEGGGDTPEHVNKALHDAVKEINWDDGAKLKLVFLVGDCPPHMDYNDGYDFHNTCGEAVENDIIINTVLCGDSHETERVWRKIARLSEGSYASVPQEGGMAIIHTPMDSELAELNTRLEATVVAFGSEDIIAGSAEKREKVKRMAPMAAAERAAYKSAASEISAYDLVDAVKRGDVDLEKLKDEELPDEMRSMNLGEKEKYLKEKEEEREVLKRRIVQLSRERNEYIASRIKNTPRIDSFDESVQKMIREQAWDAGIRY